MKSQSSHSLGFLVGITAIGILGWQSNLQGQCIDRQSLAVPMWEIYGINPYHPQSVTQTTHVTPTFAPGYQPVSPIQVELQIGTVYPNPLDGVPIVIGEISGSVVQPDFSNIEMPNSISSPSDIVITKKTNEAPTLANESVTKAGATPDVERDTASAARLAEAEKEIARLKSQLDSSVEKARSAANRAYAAEKSAESNAKNAKRKLVQLDNESITLAQMEKEAEAEIQNRNAQIAALTRQFAEAKREFEKSKVSQSDSQQDLITELNGLRRENKVLIAKAKELGKSRDQDRLVAEKKGQEVAELKSTLSQLEKEREELGQELVKLKNRSKKTRSQVEGSEMAKTGSAQAEVDRLNAEAKEGMRDSEAKQAADTKEAALNKLLEEESNNAKEADPVKKKRAKFNAEEQIKKLNASMERQIEKSSELIQQRGKSRIEQLIKNGHKDSDDEVAKVRKKIESDLKENESKIRKRIEERIQRIQKEAEARRRS